MDYGPSPESSDHVRAWLAEARRRLRPSSSTGASPSRRDLFDVFNPATGERIAGVDPGLAADVDAAVAAARKALPKWSALAGHERARFLYALARHVQKRERFLAVLETIDNGKPIRESRDIDVPLVARHFYHHAGWASLIESEFPGTRPVGVCGQIIPWNFPLLMLAWKIAPALAAGCTVVLKPAEQTPLTALAFAEICVEAGLARRRRQHRHRRRRDRARRSSRTRASTRSPSPARPRSAGRSARRPPERGKKLTLELGGKSPFVVFDDADLDSAVEGVVDAIWFNQGQVCCAGSRLLAAGGHRRRALRQAARADGASCGSAIRSTSRPTSARSSRPSSSSASSG